MTREEALAELEPLSLSSTRLLQREEEALRIVLAMARAFGPMLEALEVAQRSDHFMATSGDRQAARDIRTQALALARKETT